MTTVSSRVSHRRTIESDGLRSKNGAKVAIWSHRKCIAGDGHTKELCSSRKRLLTIARQYGFAWIVHTLKPEDRLD